MDKKDVPVLKAILIAAFTLVFAHRSELKLSKGNAEKIVDDADILAEAIFDHMIEKYPDEFVND